MLQAVLFVIILLIENQVMCMQKDRAQKRRDLKGRIMLIHIKNENETAAIDTLGAELVSFMGDDGFEHIWQGDKTYWGGHAPVLFPIVGALRDNRTCINGEWYEIEAEELLARCIMHETDHLDGKMYVDIMSREIFEDEDADEDGTAEDKA